VKVEELLSTHNIQLTSSIFRVIFSDSMLRLLPLAAAALLAGVCSAFVPASTFVSRTTASSAKKSYSSLYMVEGQGGQTYNKVFVAGGSKGVGRLVVEKLVGSGTGVVALVRSEEAAAELNALDGVTAVIGDAFDYKAVEGAMDGCDAAMSTLGGGTVEEGKQRVDYEGNSNVIEAAGILGVTRVVLITSIGCGSSKEAAPPSVFEVLKDVLSAKERAENILIKYYTNTNWTIIRPGGLKSEPATGTAILTEDNMAIGSIHREDVAALAIQALTSPKTKQKILSAVDPEITSAANVEGRVVEAFALA
jgi:uncharacterized protein YbjT (DUF2867 family)